MDPQQPLEQKTLEQRVQEKNQPRSQDDVLLYPIENYVRSFSDRYKHEKSFRDIVHSYLGIGTTKKATLKIGKWLRPKWYDRKVDVLIHTYAIQIRESMVKARDLRKELDALAYQEEALAIREKEIKKTAESAESLKTEVQQVVTQQQGIVEKIETEVQQKIQEEEQKKKEVVVKVREDLDPKKMVRDHLLQQITASDLVVVNKAGEMGFDTGRVAEKLEDFFLDEVLSDMAKEGNTGFFQKLKQTYEGLITYTDEIESLEEMPNIDWVESSIYSRTRGFRVPTFPYLIVGKAEERVRVAISVDTALAVDISGSMRNNKRFEMAQKTSLSLNGLMRRLNPRNQSHLAVYNEGSVKEVTSAQLMREVQPDGGTPTHRALEWLLEKLSDSPLAIAYIVTDGAPDAQEACVKVARKFRNYPNVLLRMFHIDADEATTKKMHEIAEAAGKGTKVAGVNNYQLAGGLIKDVADALGEMYTI